MLSASLHENLNDRKLCKSPESSIGQDVMSRVEVERDASSNQYTTLVCRSFWRAAAQDELLKTSRSYSPERLDISDFERSRVHPKFLHTNATSHKWAFGAVAEILDNAVDEISNGATFIKVDRFCNKKENNSPALLFQDDGGGMDPDGIRQCMSLGFSAKKATEAIGQYGNGFKTSTMRLGSDVIVFSCSTRGGRMTVSVGLLSYTFLVRTMKSHIIVPVIDFEIVDGQALPMIYGSQGDWDECLDIILKWSPFCSNEELMMQFDDIGSHGTKIFVYNLWYDDDGFLELDFDDDEEDIRLRNRVKAGGISNTKNELIESHISYTFRYSLRAYASILYLKSFPNFRIILRGKPVQQLHISDDLKFIKTVRYRPFVGKDESVDAKVGFTKEAPLLGMYGFNVYHKNRLILPFWKVFQEGSNRGKCVVGVLEANFIEPAHDKQDFERSPLYIRLETRLKKMITEYWTNHCHLVGYHSPLIKIQERKKRSSFNITDLVHEVAAGSPVLEFSAASLPVENPVVGLSINIQEEMAIVQPVSEISTNYQETKRDVSTVSDLGSTSDSAVDVADVSFPMHYVAPQTNVFGSSSLKKISEENIQLFLKREDYRCRETELKQTIKNLEDELEQTRRKCAKLSRDLRDSRNQRIARQ